MESSKFSKQQRDYIFEIRYFFRKTIPDNVIFYLFILFIKFIPIFLMSTNVSHLESDNTTIHSFFMNFLIFNSDSIPQYDYVFICIVIYCFLLLYFAIKFTLVIKTYYSSESDKDFFLNQETNKIKIPSYIKKLKILEIIMFIIIFVFSQHIIEFLFFGLYLCYAVNEPQKRFDENVYGRLFNFVSGLSINKYAIGVLNVIFMLYVFYICYRFIKMFSYSIIVKSHGFKWDESKIGTFIFLFLWSCQGIYSVSFFYLEEHQKKYRLTLCCVLIVCGILRIINHLREKINIQSAVSLMCDFLFNMSFASALFEIFIYIFGKDKIKNDFSLYKMVVEVINGFLITEVIKEINLWQQRKILGKNIFSVEQSLKKVRFINANILETFFMKINKGPDDEKTINLLISIFQCHLSMCNNEKCNCRSYQKDGKDFFGYQMYSFFKTTSKKMLLAFILKSEQHAEGSKSFLEKMYILQTSYELLVEKNYSKALYFSQMGLSNMKKMSFDSLYTLYELRKLTMKAYRKINNENEFANCKGSYKQIKQKALQNQKRKENYIKINTLIFEEILYEKIKQALCEICNSLEIVINYKHIFNSKVKINFSTDDIIHALRKYLNHIEHLKIFIKKYFVKNRMHTSEIEYLLSIFYDIFKIEAFNYTALTTKLKTKSILEKKMLEQLKSYLILLLSDEKIIVKYLDLNLLNTLQYSKIEIYEMDFSRLLPSRIAPSHFEHMKKYIINCDPRMSFHKKTFLINKEKDIVPVRITSRFFPSFENPLCLINEIDILDKLHEETNDDNNYIVLLNEYFGMECFNKEFESDFFINRKVFDNLNMNLTFCEIFGINEESLKKHFKFEKKAIAKVETLNTTTIDQIEDLYIDTKEMKRLTTAKTNRQIKIIQVKKQKVINILNKIEKALNESKICSEWDNNATSYMNKLWDSKNTWTKNQRNPTISSNMTGNTFDDIITIKIELRLLEHLQYYYVTIKSKKDKVDFINGNPTTHYANLSLFAAHSSSKLSTEKIRNFRLAESPIPSFNMNAINNSINDPIPSPTTTNSRQVVNSSLIELNNSVNGSKETLFVGQNRSRAKSFLSQSFDEESYIEIGRLNFLFKRTQYKIHIIRIALFSLYSILFVIIIVNFCLCHTILRNTLKVITVNSYANLLHYDIFAGSLSIYRSCFYSEGILKGSPELVLQRKEQTEIELIGHYHSLIKTINELVRSGEGDKLSEILNQSEDYSYLMQNWGQTTKEKTFVEEIRYFHYYLSHFTIDDDNLCRIRKFFYNKKVLSLPEEDKENFKPSFEERIIYYIMKNVISVITNNTQKMIKICHAMLTDYYSKFRIYIYTFYPLTLGISLMIYGMVFYSIFLNRRILTKYSKNLLIKKRFDYLFERELFEFKQLISNYSFSECLNFEKKVIESYDKIETIKSRSPSITKIGGKKRSSMKMSPRKNKKNSLIIPLELENIKKDKGRKKEEGEQPASSMYEKRKCKDANIIRYSFFAMIFQYIIFITIQIISISLNVNFCDNSQIQNRIAIAFFGRIPKICELYLYTLVSIILGDPNFVTKDDSEWDLDLANYYNIETYYKDDKLYKKIGNSNFIYLQYLIDIYRTNLKYFINDKSTSNLLKLVTKAENTVRNNNGDFCIYTSFWYIEKCKYKDDKTKKPQEIFSESSDLVQYCRTLGNGINLSGVTIALDLYITQIVNMFDESIELPSTDENIDTHISSEILFTLGSNLQTNMKYFHLVEQELVNEDISKMVKSRQTSIIVLSVISILLCFFLIIFVLSIMVNKMGKYIMIINESANHLDVIINKYDMK